MNTFRIQQMSLTIGDLEAALTDRTSELRELESQRDTAVHQLDGAKRSERTREVVGRVFADSLSITTTLSPLSSSISTRLDPMNPAPPVTTLNLCFCTTGSGIGFGSILVLLSFLIIT